MQQERLLLIMKSQQMLTAAENSSWEDLTLLESEFQALVREFFAKNEDHQLSEQLIEQNQQIQQLIKLGQKQLLSEKERDLSKIKAAENYLANT